MPNDLTGFPDHRSGDRYGVFRVSEVGDQRWGAALARFAEGGAIAFDDIAFQTVQPDRLLVSPTWSQERSATKEEAEEAFARGDTCLAFLTASDPAFAELVRGRRVEMELLADDGMGMVLIATRVDGEISLA